MKVNDDARELTDMSSEYRKKIEEIARQRNGGGVSNDELFDLMLAGFRDNSQTHEAIITALNRHCTDENAHTYMKNQDFVRAGGWVRDKFLAPLVVAIALILINFLTVR